MEIKVLRNATPEEIAGVLRVERVCMGSWGYDDAEEYYPRMIAADENINIIAKNSDFVYGYLLAVPHNSVVEELKDADPEINEDAQRLYVETLDVLPKYGRDRQFIKMFYALFSEAEERFTINRFSAHVRCENGLSLVVQSFFRGMITSVRRLEKWKYYNGEEATDYIELTFIKALSRMKPRT